MKHGTIEPSKHNSVVDSIHRIDEKELVENGLLCQYHQITGFVASLFSTHNTGHEF